MEIAYFFHQTTCIRFLCVNRCGFCKKQAKKGASLRTNVRAPPFAFIVVQDSFPLTSYVLLLFQPFGKAPCQIPAVAGSRKI